MKKKRVWERAFQKGFRIKKEILKNKQRGKDENKIKKNTRLEKGGKVWYEITINNAR